MNKKEKQILLNAYDNILQIQELTGINKNDSITELKKVLCDLNLKDDATIIENKHYYTRNNFNNVKIEVYENLINIVKKYTVTAADILEDTIYNLECELSPEHKKCCIAGLNYIK